MLAGGMLALGYRSLTGRCILATLLPPFALGLQVAQTWIPGRTQQFSTSPTLPLERCSECSSGCRKRMKRRWRDANLMDLAPA
jgi:hypothetical protein